MRRATDGFDRLMERCVPSRNGCIVPTAQKERSGYTRTFHLGRRIPSHRLAYERMVGPIPDGLVIDHLCRNRACVNPYHLEAVTMSENVRRGDLPAVNRARFLGRDACKNGHLWADGDYFINARGARACRPCKRENYHAHKVAA